MKTAGVNSVSRPESAYCVELIAANETKSERTLSIINDSWHSQDPRGLAYYQNFDRNLKQDYIRLYLLIHYEGTHTRAVVGV
jgi:hypothetical protein